MFAHFFNKTSDQILDKKVKRSTFPNGGEYNEGRSQWISLKNNVK